MSSSSTINNNNNNQMMSAVQTVAAVNESNDNKNKASPVTVTASTSAPSPPPPPPQQDLEPYKSEPDLGCAFDHEQGPLQYESHMHSVAAIAIRCVHGAMPLTPLHIATKPGLWLPYVRTKRPLKYQKVVAQITDFFVKELK